MKKLIVLTGAGISAESGIPTFRDSDGLWEKYNVYEVATPEAWHKDPGMVLEFYNMRRRKLLEVNPNQGHLALVELEKKYDVTIITQNIDDLHERAGSKNILHLHGELLKARSERYEDLIYDWPKDICLGDQCERGFQLRPHIVWFGERVPMIETAAQEASYADIILIVGTSMQVYPAAGLVSFAPEGIPIYYIDPKPAISYELVHLQNVHVVEEPASTGVKKVVDELLK